jgi:hypothetical protein
MDEDEEGRLLREIAALEENGTVAISQKTPTDVEMLEYDRLFEDFDTTGWFESSSDGETIIDVSNPELIKHEQNAPTADDGSEATLINNAPNDVVQPEVVVDKTALFKLVRETSAKLKKDAQENGLIAQAFDAIDAHRSANKPAHNKKRRKQYAAKIEEAEKRVVRGYSVATPESRREQNRVAQKKKRESRSPSELNRVREANRLRSKKARDEIAKLKLL